MGALCGLALGAIIGFVAARVATERAILELKDVIARGEKIRKRNEEGSGNES